MKKKYLMILLLSLLTTAAMAQVNKIPADTRLYLQTLENSYKQARARSMNGKVKQKEAKLFLSCAPDADMKAIESQLKAIGARPQGTIGRYIMVSTSVNVVDQIADIEGVTFINRSPAVSQKTLVSREATGVSKVQQGTDGLPQAFTGKGVVVGVVDGGFDFDHPAFKDDADELRIKAFYAPGLSLEDEDAPVMALDGTELAGKSFTTPEEILALESDDTEKSHGSHCASIAAGSTFDWAGGMAPGADIVLCAFNMSDDDADDDADADDAGYNIIQSIIFIRDYAERVGKPYIVSISLNTNDGPHDGTSFTSNMIDMLALENTNMVLAASNDGDAGCYINHAFAANDTLHTIVEGNLEASAFTRAPGEISFQIGLYDLIDEREVWRSEPLRSNDDGCNFILGFGDEYESYTSTSQYDDIKSQLAEIIDNGVFGLSIGKLEDGRAKMTIRGMGMDGSRYITFHIVSSENSMVDLWGDSGTRFTSEETGDYYTAGNSSISMGDWCTGGNTITVGSWVAKTSFTNIYGETDEGDPSLVGDGVGAYSPFSSYGTDLGGHDHPFVSAPGSLIISALNHNDPEYGEFGDSESDVVAMDDDGFTWGVMSGTSMSTPTVAGIIALWLEAKPDLTYEEIKETIVATSTKDEFTEAAPIRFGNGKIDAYKGLLHILDITTSIPSLSQHQPKGVTFRMSGSQLTISGADDGTPIRIYTTDGRLVASTALVGGCVSLPAASPAGIYAVQVGSLGSSLIRKQ